MTVAFLALGSNLDRPHWRLRGAVSAIKHLPQTRLLRCSSIFRSAPDGPAIQAQYLNAVVSICTTLSPLALLDHTQGIEQRGGRKRRQRWGPRTLDIDILLYGQHILSQRRLTIPHPRLAQRRFAVEPLLEIAPDLRLPDGQQLQHIAARLKSRQNPADIYRTSLVLNS